jgi:hypothetical protein
MSKEFNVGDLVVINKDDPNWEHLKEKEDTHPLKLQGVITEVRKSSYVVAFDNWTAYLRSGDLIKISE